MSKVEGLDRLFSLVSKKRFGVFCKFATSQFGLTNFGDDDIYYSPTGGTPVLLSGIYRTFAQFGYNFTVRNRYYITKNPRTVLQQANRQKYADGVLAWQGLTSEQKQIYNNKAIGKRMSGYNFYLQTYLRSN